MRVQFSEDGWSPSIVANSGHPIPSRTIVVAVAVVHVVVVLVVVVVVVVVAVALPVVVAALVVVLVLVLGVAVVAAVVVVVGVVTVAVGLAVAAFVFAVIGGVVAVPFFVRSLKSRILHATFRHSSRPCRRYVRVVSSVTMRAQTFSSKPCVDAYIDLRSSVDCRSSW